VERGTEGEVPFPRTQHNDPGHGSNLDCLIKPGLNISKYLAYEPNKISSIKTATADYIPEQDYSI